MRSARYAVIAATLMLWPMNADAHPHIFAEARLEIVAGDDGHVAELQNVWRFDEVFSSSVILDFDSNANRELEPDELASLAEVMRQSLADYGYFTKVTVNGAPIAVAKPDVIRASFDGGQLIVLFAVKPEKPVPLKSRLTFSV